MPLACSAASQRRISAQRRFVWLCPFASLLASVMRILCEYCCDRVTAWHRSA